MTSKQETDFHRYAQVIIDMLEVHYQDQGEEKWIDVTCKNLALIQSSWKTGASPKSVFLTVVKNDECEKMPD